jgi:hypothetical protein
MGQVIRFPRTKKRSSKKVEDFFVERLPSHEQHCDLGAVSFTCATCSNITTFNFRGAVFRELSFYCGSCGVGYKLNNPLFSPNRKKRAQ